MKQNVVVRMAGENIVVDLMKSVGEINYEKLKKHVVREVIEEIEIPFADLDSMIELKKGVRDTDKRDCLFLEGKKDFLQKQKK